MEALAGILIPNLGFTPKQMGHLLYHEGPLLTHFINEENPSEHYIFKWADYDQSANRWLVFKVTTNDLLCFFDKKKTWLALIQQNPFLFVVDIQDDLSYKQVILLATAKLPADYLPTANSFFKENKYENYADILKVNLLADTLPSKEILDNIMLSVQKIAADVAQIQQDKSKWQDMILFFEKYVSPKAQAQENMAASTDLIQKKLKD